MERCVSMILQGGFESIFSALFGEVNHQHDNRESIGQRKLIGFA